MTIAGVCAPRLDGRPSHLQAGAIVVDSRVARPARASAILGSSALLKPESRDIRRAALLASSLFQALRAEEIDEVLAFATERVHQAGSVIFQKGDDGSSMLAVLSGRVRISVVSGEGKEVVLNVIDAGEFFGEIALLDGKPRSADATAIDETHVLIVDRKHFIPFIKRHDDVALRLLSVMCERVRRTTLSLEGIALLPLPARLARVLLNLADNYGRAGPRGVQIEMKWSQDDLAKLVAATRESVNKQWQLWKKDRVVTKEGGYMLLLQPRALKALTE
jgi:CRP-like cAMP-binding protein